MPVVNNQVKEETEEDLQQAIVENFTAFKQTLDTVKNVLDDAKREIIHLRSENASLRNLLSNATTGTGKLNELKDEIELLDEERDKCLYWLIKAYNCLGRAGWEEGLNDTETRSRLCDFLFNRGLQAGLPEHNAEVAALLAKVESFNTKF